MNLVIDSYCSSSRKNSRVRIEESSYCSLGSVILCFYIWIKSIQGTSSEKKRSIQMTGVRKEAMPKEIIQIRLPVMRFNYVSKDWNDYFSRRSRSLQQVNGSTPIGFICINKIDNYAAANHFFLYTLEKHVFGGANQFLYFVSKENKLYCDCIVAYDYGDPNGHVRLIQVPSTLGDSLYGNIKRLFEGMKDGSLHFINIKDTRNKRIHMTTSEKKRSIQYMDLVPNEIVEDEFLFRLPVKTLMRLKCVSKDWNDFISDGIFRKRYRSLLQANGNAPTGFICGDIIDENARVHGFVVAKKFLYTSENYVAKEELECFDYLSSFGYVIAASKGLLLVAHNLSTLSVYDLVSKKHVNLPRNNIKGDNVSLGFKCEERSSSSSNDHLCSSFKVVCVDSPGVDRFPTFGNYNVQIYSSETGTWQKSIMKSRLVFQIWDRHIAKVIRGVFYWHEMLSGCLIAYDFEDPKGHAVFFQLPVNKKRLYRKEVSQLEGTKDGSLQFIDMDDMVLKVWVLQRSTSGRNYMDEDDHKIYASRWSLAASVCLCDVGFRFGNIYHLQQYQSKRIIGADPIHPHIIFLEIMGQLYAYDYLQGKVVFTFSQKLAWKTDVFIHFEWPTWPCL